MAVRSMKAISTKLIQSQYIYKRIFLKTTKNQNGKLCLTLRQNFGFKLEISFIFMLSQMISRTKQHNSPLRDLTLSILTKTLFQKKCKNQMSSPLNHMKTIKMVKKKSTSCMVSNWYHGLSIWRGLHLRKRMNSTSQLKCKTNYQLMISARDSFWFYKVNARLRAQRSKTWARKEKQCKMFIVAWSWHHKIWAKSCTSGNNRMPWKNLLAQL